MPKIPNWVFLILVALHFSAVRIDMMDIDATQYAEISREMAQSGDYLHLYDRGIDYLDKPPMLFWVSSASMKIFGVNNFGYKFPSILFAIWAMYAVYRLTRRMYNEETGRMAALILGTCQGMFLMTNDVRTDTILMSCVVTALWMIYEANIKRKSYWVLGGTLAIACGMMTKGPIALLVPAFCFGTDWLLKRQWKKIFNPYHIVDVILIAIFLIPMSIGLYQQFDMHPEKTVNGLQHVSGLRFFYWSQSFGRITGESPWDNGAPFEFLFVGMFWAFLPWMFLFVPALVLKVTELIKQKFKLQPQQEWITTGGFILSYIALGSSKYQLPHYIFVVFPLCAIMVAKLIADFAEGKYAGLLKVMKPLQAIASALIMIAALLTIVVVFPTATSGFMIVLWTIVFGIWLFMVIRKTKVKYFWLSVAAIIFANVFLTHHFYYNLLQYQLGSKLGKYIKEKRLDVNSLTQYKIDHPLNALHYYADKVIALDSNELQSGNYVLASYNGMADIKQQNIPYELLLEGDYFKCSELTPEFLNPQTRNKATQRFYFIRMK
ncbi:MAG: glycosyltransferase family 39 protein [Bacteroidetes bacterium]|nr:glycosyltransferase family 39 protein [Bacteroidota bacterium]